MNQWVDPHLNVNKLFVDSALNQPKHQVHWQNISWLAYNVAI